MTTSQILNSTNRQEVRTLAFSFAKSVNFKVSSVYNELQNEWMNMMSEIHANGKEGNYDGAILLGEAIETLKTWA
jgi:hypothetical protein